MTWEAALVGEIQAGAEVWIDFWENYQYTVFPINHLNFFAILS
jgi:hypothetical protein